MISCCVPACSAPRRPQRYFASPNHELGIPANQQSERGGKRAGDRLFWGVVGVSAALTVLTLIASRFVPPPRFPPGAAALPRMKRPPATAGELLVSLGVGSLIWYACFLGTALHLDGRRLPFDRRRQVRSFVVHLAVVALLAALTAAWLQYHVSYRGSPMAPQSAPT